MFKSVIALAGASALVMGSGTAYAIPGHIYSPTNPIVLEGYASLGSNLCYLRLSATLAETHTAVDHTLVADWYNVITNVTGTNDPILSPGPLCPYISIVGGSGEVTGPDSIDLDSLIIRVTGQPDCEAGPVAVLVENDGDEVNVQVAQETPCGGDITADLSGVGQIG